MRLLCLAVLLSSAVSAQPDDSRFVLNTLAVMRLHPIGAEVRATVSYVDPIGSSDELLWKSRFWAAGVTGAVNPAEAAAQAFVEIEPIAVFQLRAMAEYRGYFGNFNELLSFPELTPVYNDQIISELGAAGRNAPSHRWTLRLDPTLRAAFGPIGVQNVSTFAYAAARVPAGNPVYYDPGIDMLRPSHGVTLSNTFSVVYLGGPLTAGLLHEWHLPLGLSAADQIHRVGGVAAYVFYEDKLAWLNKPTLFALAYFNVQHRGRVPWLPTFVVGFSGETALWRKR